MVQVARVVDAGDDPLAEVLLLGHLADQEVVLVVAGDRDHEVGALDARALEHPQLGGVAVLDGVLELLLDGQVAAAVLLDAGDLVPLLQQLAREVPADLAGAGDDDVEPVLHHALAQRRLLQLLDRDLRRADRLQALLGVPGRAARIEHAGDHAVDVEPPLRDLRDDQVRVVAVGGGDEDVGLLDAGLDQRVDLQRRPDREAAARLLPGAPELDVQPLVRERVLVEDRHDMAIAQR